MSERKPLPEGWRRCPLGEIALITSGGTPDRSEPSYWGGDIPWVTTGEIRFNTIIDTTEKLTDAGLKNSAAKLFPPGTLLMAMYGQGKTRGQVAKLGIEASTNQNAAAIHLHHGHVSDFYFQYLWWKYEAIREFGQSGGISHLNAGLLKQISVPVAPTHEQRRIALVLATWDEAIVTTERLLADSRKQKQALFKYVLRHSKKWEMMRLGDISTRVRRRSDGGNYPVLMISASNGFVKQSDMYSRFMAGKSLDNYVLLNQGEFAYNKGNSNSYEFGCIYPLDGFSKGLVPHVYVCFSLDEDRCFRRFYKYLFEADYLHDQLGAVVNTGVRNNGLLNIRPLDFMGARVPLPPIDDQKRIATILDAATASIHHIERDLGKLRQEKSALMQQLLTGKRRVRLREFAEVASA